MLWPAVLPFQITCGVIVLATLGYTFFPYPRSLSKAKAFFVSSAIATIAFIPSCTGIMVAVDAVRFGDFHYESYNAVPDFRSQRYLPENATDIYMHKFANGYYARYKLQEDEFRSYLDGLWQQYGEQSAVERGSFVDEGRVVDPELFALRFDHADWECPVGSIVYYSPSEPDGGGATYYVDADTGTVIQRTGFW